jgi:hypothetical protein
VGRSVETQGTPRGSLTRETRNGGGARARIPYERTKWLYLTYLSSCGRRAKRAGFGRVRRDAAAAGEGHFSRCSAGQGKYYRLYYTPRCKDAQIGSPGGGCLRRAGGGEGACARSVH